jgi:molybdopterin-binding protein
MGVYWLGDDKNMNTLSATITTITTSEHLSILTVAVGDDLFHLLLAEASNAEDLVGTSVTLAFKETEVILTKESINTTANIQRATVQKIEQGTVLSQITLLYHETIITALVPTLTFDTLEINEANKVYWMVQPSEISLLRGSNGI